MHMTPTSPSAAVRTVLRIWTVPYLVYLCWEICLSPSDFDFGNLIRFLSCKELLVFVTMFYSIMVSCMAMLLLAIGLAFGALSATDVGCLITATVVSFVFQSARRYFLIADFYHLLGYWFFILEGGHFRFPISQHHFVWKFTNSFNATVWAIMLLSAKVKLFVCF